MNREFILNNESADGTSRLYSISKLLDIANENEQFVKRMLRLCLETLPVSVNEINTYFEKKEFLNLSTVAHSLKATIDTMGIISLQDEIRKIEKISKENNPEESLIPLLKKLNQVKDILVIQLEEDLK